MPVGVPEERARVLAVVRALKAVGVRVRNWKNFLHGEKTLEHTPVQEAELFAFGRDLQLLPQCNVDEVDGAVPRFLVEACDYLSQHLHTEGIFRKTGSLSRIRTLRADLERGEPIFQPPHDALLQPCDVASVLKQFLRELPEPLIGGELQVALCHAQTLEEGSRERATLLLTSLLPPAHARSLRYVCGFLGRVSHRCEENRMEVGSLALVMAPNLLPCSAQTCRLTVQTEKQLDQQAAAIATLILHAERIGVVPSCVLETLGMMESTESTLPLEGALFNKRTRLSVYSNLTRQRRRSVGEIFVDAFSKLKSGRTPTGPSISLDPSSAGPLLSKSPTPQSPNTVKRKATEETVPEADGSAKKRRSLHDLRGDTQSINSHSAEESTGTQSPPALKISQEETHLNVSRRRSQVRSHRKSRRPTKQEEQVHLRRRTLRFFSMSNSSGSGGSPALSLAVCDDSESDSSSCTKKSGTALRSSDSESSLKIPFILIEEPGRVVIGSEVDDDPDLLNCSFVENQGDVLLSDCEETTARSQRQENDEVCEDDRWVVVEDANSEVVVDYDGTQDETLRQEAGSPGDDAEVKEPDAEADLKPKQSRRSTKERSRPRRSISMPEVALDVHSDEADGVRQADREKESQIHEDIWSASVSVPHKKKQKEGREVRRRRCGTVHDHKKEKDSDGSSKKLNSRLSMAERFRSFSVVASFLRTPTVRLRRQGARRFSRSFSDEGVREDQQAFLELNDELTDSEEPPVSPSTPSPPSASSLEDLTLISSAQKSQDDPDVHITNPQSEPIISEVPEIKVFDLDKVFEQQCHLTEHPACSDSHLDLTFTPTNQQRASFSSSLDSHFDVGFDVSTPSSQQRALFTSSIDSCSFTGTDRGRISPQFASYETSPCKTINCFSFDGVFSISSVSEKCSLSLDLSPPPFQFRPQASRRRYRDSPRWPSHEVRMTTWKPLPF